MRILPLIALVSLAACATADPAPLASADMRGSGVTAVATLAPLGSFEWRAAPTITTITLARQRATSLLRSGRLSVDAARHVQALADEGRARFEAAIEADRARDAATADRLLREASATAREAIDYLDRSVR